MKFIKKACSIFVIVEDAGDHYETVGVAPITPDCFKDGKYTFRYAIGEHKFVGESQAEVLYLLPHLYFFLEPFCDEEVSVSVPEGYYKDGPTFREDEIPEEKKTDKHRDRTTFPLMTKFKKDVEQIIALRLVKGVPQAKAQNGEWENMEIDKPAFGPLMSGNGEASQLDPAELSKILDLLKGNKPKGDTPSMFDFLPPPEKDE